MRRGRAALNLVLKTNFTDKNQKGRRGEKMLVLKTRVITENREFVYNTKCFYYNPSNSKKKRGVRLCKTGEGKKKRNERAAYLKIKHDCFENFNVGDYWVTLTHMKHLTPEEADKILGKVLGKMQKRLKRKNIPFVWYRVTEAGENQRVHHHLLIRNTSPEIISMLLGYWKEYGIVTDPKEITDMESGNLVKYFLDGGKHKNLTYQKFGHSRNLRKPKVIKRVVPMRAIRENPRVPKCEEYGYRYEIAKGTLFNGFPDLDGFTYQEYELIKVKDTPPDVNNTLRVL